MFGPQFLDHAHGGVQGNHHEDHREVGEIVQGRRQDRSAEKQQDHRIPELSQDPGEDAGWGDLGDRVRAVLLECLGGFGLGQSGRPGRGGGGDRHTATSL